MAYYSQIEEGNPAPTFKSLNNSWIGIGTWGFVRSNYCPFSPSKRVGDDFSIQEVEAKHELFITRNIISEVQMLV